MAFAMIAACGEFDEMTMVSNSGGAVLVNAVRPLNKICHALLLGLLIESNEAGLLVSSRDVNRLATCQSCTGAIAAASVVSKSPVQSRQVIRPEAFPCAHARMFVDLR